MPSRSRISGPHAQPPRRIISAMPAIRSCSCCGLSVSSSSSSCAAVPIITARSWFVWGRGKPSRTARPAGVGRQKRAGRTKAKSSSTSKARSIVVLRRASVQRRWQIRGGFVAAARAAADRPHFAIAPSGPIMIAPASSGKMMLLLERSKNAVMVSTIEQRQQGAPALIHLDRQG